MNQTTVLIIDDSTTIRRLVDRALTAAGYRVVAAPTAEDGLQQLETLTPDLILLDHQLPGTTGTEVARKLLELPRASQIPVVVSSTLRKRAYSEYMELANVVDMLPKPYTEELLITTVENALSTASMVVASQTAGTAVPEVIQAAGEPDLAGRFGAFQIREMLDFLNTAAKSGLLEVEGQGYRVFFFISEGRIAGVSSSGVDLESIEKRIPESLQSLAPLMRLTLGGRGASELNSLVELLNRKVVDPRLLRRLLRFQASALTWRCFNEPLTEFRFTAGVELPPLCAQLPLSISLPALLIEGASTCDLAELPEDEDDFVYMRRSIRGQNLDRAGISAEHMKMLNLLGERAAACELATQLNSPPEEVRRTLYGMYRAQLIDRSLRVGSRQVIVLEPNPKAAGQLREALSADGARYYGKVVRDRLALHLALRRSRPDVIVCSTASRELLDAVRELQRADPSVSEWKLLGLAPEDSTEVSSCQAEGLCFDAMIGQPCNGDSLFKKIDELFETPIGDALTVGA